MAYYVSKNPIFLQRKVDKVQQLIRPTHVLQKIKQRAKKKKIYADLKNRLTSPNLI